MSRVFGLGLSIALSFSSLPLLSACGDGGSGGSGGSGASGAGGATSSTSSSSSSGSNGTGGEGGSMVMLGDVAVTVEYAGAQTGTLNIAVVTSFPPNGPPVAFQSFATPAFPQQGTLIGLEADKPVYVVAVLDVGSNNPQSPGPEDLVAITMPPIDVAPGSSVPVTLTLMDP